MADCTKLFCGELTTTMTKYRTILVFGPPGSGKGTQGKTLGTLPGFFHCACGDVFRAIDVRTEIGAAFLEYSSKGQLVLDGIPRNQHKARLMEDVLAVERVFHLTGVPDDAIAMRLKKRALKDNRLDDASDEVVRRRLEVYRNECKSLLEYYPWELINNIDAMQPPHAVLCEILSSLVGAKSIT